MFTESEQDLIGNCFGGDAEAFIAAHINSKRKTLKWNDIVATGKVFPEYALDAHNLIKRLLGYLPPDYLTIPYGNFIRAVLHRYHSGGISEDEMLEEAEEYIKLIRNKDMETHSNLYYSREVYQRYFDYLPEFKEITKERLTLFLGYEPQLEHSVIPETLLRECFVDDRFNIQDGILSSTDIQGITIIKYREALFKFGKAKADDSPLIAVDLCYYLLKNKKLSKI
ncbi:hypothetical protein VB264_21085 [Arcicella aquatica]|uniref:Uncharacterized protein n=1 Tax=Arcicella aquatica TaxID=217141 RepID=A0ABU5QT79_9BACT|nr:hypothetical protein [Arcicella aquatica]MEA5260307.1 hypothetical protein [Arcicella aquatica]